MATPWGEASELRRRRLYPGGGTPPDEVARNQRERLFGAIVAVTSEKGYEAATVADVLTLSGVSRSAFYRHFASKSECLVAAVSELLEPALEAAGPRDRRDGSGEPRQVFEGFFELLRSQPAAARVCFVELHAAGEPGEEAADRAVEALAVAIERGFGDLPGTPDPALTRVLIGGLRKLIHTRLLRGEESELPALAPDLWRWALGVVSPPGPVEAPRRQRGTAGPTFRGYTPGERIASAVAEVVATNGYGGTSTDAIAAQASISLSTFYAHFSDKQDAVLGALEMSGAQITALAVPAARRAGDWQEGVRALYEAIGAYFAAEPAMAQLALAGVYGAGPLACARRDRVIDSLTEMLAPGFAENPAAPAISSEAIAATVYALMREQLRREGPESIGAVVPLATYITLVGFVGPERALEVANGRAGRR
ncbi:MAG TPA: TetR/AcrR family transcriptional regulator [Solirubrobacterales bacterium]|nr:TetR/AcrR family transcriptional regulator [Solirubrobacterales bacterium]